MTQSPELHNIVTFLHAQHPFDILSVDAVQHAAKTLEISYQPKNQRIFESGDDNSYLYIVRTGAVEITDERGNLAEQCGEGDFFGFPSVLTEIPTRYTATTIEDTLLYMLHTSMFHELRRNYPEFDQHFVMVHSERLRDTRIMHSKEIALTTHLGHLLSREPVTVKPDVPIHVAAQHMRDERVSSLLIVEDEQLVGILTDRDIRNRFVAESRAYDTLISEIMTPKPLTIEAHQQSLEAQMLMSRHNIHHLPVMEDGQLVGLITTTDLMRLQASSAVHLIGEISKQNNVDDIAKVASKLPQLILSLVDADATAYDIGHLITQVTDTITCRLLELAKLEFGAPPLPYVWLAFGSQGRQEQSAKTDQDNGLLLATEPSEAENAYFMSLAKFVCDGLATCGYEYCTGGIMATNWCYSLDTWREKFAKWIDKPEPEALLNVSIFFDMRPVEGDFSLAHNLVDKILAKAKGNAVFLGSMAKNALGFQPPLGFFRRFVLEKGGEHHHTLDIKHKGITPIIDMTRVYSLAYGINATNTADRLKALIPTPAIATEDGANLRDTLEFIAYVRLHHQGAQIAKRDAPDNFVDPDILSSFERQHLKTAFNIVRRMQSTLSQRYMTSFLS